MEIPTFLTRAVRVRKYRAKGETQKTFLEIFGKRSLRLWAALRAIDRGIAEKPTFLTWEEGTWEYRGKGLGRLGFGTLNITKLVSKK